MQNETTVLDSPPLIFICYARKDNQDDAFKRRSLDRLLDHLKPLQRQKKARIWCDQKIDLGTQWDDEIHTALSSARVAIALMSPSFFASDYICEKEMPKIFQQVDAGQTILLPILLSPFDLGSAEFYYSDAQGEEKVRSLIDFQAANGMEKPLIGLPEHEQDAVLLRVAQRAREIVTGKKSEVPIGGERGKHTPSNLPRSQTETFVGRKVELREIHDRVQDESRLAIFAVSGMGGIGKTELVLQYAMRYRNAGIYLGAVCWVNAQQEIGSQILGFARSCLDLDLPEFSESSELVAWCWRQFPTESSLVVFDNVLDYADIEDFLPPVEERFKVLLTTRSRIESEAVSVLSIETLLPLQAYRLLYETVKDERRFEREQIQAAELCEWVGDLPLGIKLVGKFLKVEPDLSIVELLAELETERLKQDGISQIKTVFELSWERLNAAERQLAMLLGTFGKAAIAWELVDRAVEFCREETACLLLEPKALRRGRRKLSELSLLQRSGENEYQIHPLLREFFRSKMTQEEQRWITTAVAMVMIGIAKEIPQALTLEIIGAVTAAIPHLQAVAEDLMKLKSREECGISEDEDLIWVFVGISRFYAGQGLYADAEPWYAAGLTVARSLLGEQHPAVAQSLNNLAGLYQLQGRYEAAEPLYVQALELYRTLLGEQHPAVATSLNNLANLYQSQGRYEAAEPLYVQALELYRTLLGEQHPAVATSLNNLAGLYELQGRYEAAEPLYVQALELRRTLLGEQHPAVAGSLNNLAELYRSQGRYEAAEPLYVQALELKRTLLGEQHPAVATSLNNLAALYANQGRLTEAERLLVQAVEIFQQRLGEQHPHTIGAQNWLEYVRKEMG
ncbi:tetratricopeptide repeat protein [Leptolyngbya boryana CZ1]|uniref:Tetratricopeptide repeat protein n=1 Tax=Leptolyngbya boryana CZ1 TaxID=3060204 RepID=A0AA96WVN4_LEPBY|nr:tetratricopeptide repeat protein [Leptolyngbya boryana]WNZ46337.1 tetratricopeptide repeat protein [Leptolyngbya boryana CZ1]